MIEHVTHHRRESFARLLAVWNGEEALDALDTVVSSNYRGHLGLRERDLPRLKDDIADFRDRQPGVRFEIQHQFGDGAHLATRLTARVPVDTAGEPTTVCGLNISRWDAGVLAEEWAVWEPFDGD
jgi:hypothetical protein